MASGDTRLDLGQSENCFFSLYCKGVRRAALARTGSSAIVWRAGRRPAHFNQALGEPVVDNFGQRPIPDHPENYLDHRHRHRTSDRRDVGDRGRLPRYLSASRARGRQLGGPQPYGCIPRGNCPRPTRGRG